MTLIVGRGLRRNRVTSVRDLVARDARVTAANQKLRFFPLSVVEGSGCDVTDHQGRKYLDLSAAWGANSLGHAHPDVVNAISRAAASGSGASVLSAIQPGAVALAEDLLDMVPCDASTARRVLFGHSGTDANNSAISAARAATGRSRVLAFRGGYHGGYGAAQAVSGVFVEAGMPADPESSLLAYPSNDEAGGAAASAAVLAELATELQSEDVAAIIVEALQSDGGIIVPPDGFLRGLAELARRFGTLVIVDEVKVGLGRTGLLHAFQHDGAVPDIVTFGKSLGGGLPLSAVVGPAEVLDVMPASALLTTAGNAVSVAAGRAVLARVLGDDLSAHASSRGDQLRQLLLELSAEAPEIFQVRGRGLSLGIELRATPGDPHSTSDDEFAHRVIFRMWQLGVVNYLVRGNVVELTPPLTLSSEQAIRAVEVMGEAITDVRAGAISSSDLAPFLGW